MKYSIGELAGELLNQAVANAEATITGVVCYADYCGAWEYGGPIIEREKIELIYYGEGSYNGLPWEAQTERYIGQSVGDATSGPTPLIAAMRAFVRAKFGNEIEL